MQDLFGKTVIITGASRGIGAAAARVFAAQGANVMLLARTADEIIALAHEIGPNAMALQCDVSQYDALEAAVTACTARLPPRRHRGRALRRGAQQLRARRRAREPSSESRQA